MNDSDRDSHEALIETLIEAIRTIGGQVKVVSREVALLADLLDELIKTLDDSKE